MVQQKQALRQNGHYVEYTKIIDSYVVVDRCPEFESMKKNTDN
jgi:hypothetical protein